MPSRVPIWLCTLILIVLIWGNITIYRALYAPEVLLVNVLDVEQGRALLLRTPGGTTLLIDTGKDASVLRALGRELSVWQRHLDAVIMTSATSDHAGGLPDVVKRYRVSTLFRSLAKGTYAQEKTIAAATINIPVKILKRGDRLVTSDGIYIDVVWPPKEASAMDSDEGALLLRLSYGTTSVLIQNDLPLRITKWLASSDASLPPPILIISSTTPAGTYAFDTQTITRPR